MSTTAVADTFLDFLAISLPQLKNKANNIVDVFKYDGPSDWRTEVVMDSLRAMLSGRASAEIQLHEAIPPSASQLETSSDGGKIVLPDTEDKKWVVVSKPYTGITETPTTLDIQLESPDLQVPYIIPPGPLWCISTQVPDPEEELRLLKMQVSDFVRVCNAVSRGDLSQRISGWSQSIVMKQFRDVVNDMVDAVAAFSDEIKSNGTRRLVVNDSCICSIHKSVPLKGAFAEGVTCTRQLGATLIEVIRSVAHIMVAISREDYSHRLQLREPIGELLDLQCTVNAVLEQLEERAQEHQCV